ncbi:MAG: hypothetical protein F6K56_32155 [Moorea sp. SIO3G5]|nr:hypothetical protein [Moorena sp. SIO3G5]
MHQDGSRKYSIKNYHNSYTDPYFYVSPSYSRLPTPYSPYYSTQPDLTS